MSVPEISIVIPVYNRGTLIANTLASVAVAARGLNVETVVVDDGSTTPLADDLKRLGVHVDQLIRQENRGLLFARLTGLDATRGKSVLFLDSDDLVSPEKLHLHVEAMKSGDWDVTYTDAAELTVDHQGKPVGDPVPFNGYEAPINAPHFFLNVQPAPHAPVFDTAFLRRALSPAAYPPRSTFNAVAEIWFYHKASVLSARVRHLPGPHAWVGRHEGARLTDHWERLGIASLSVMEHFIADSPEGPHRDEARARVSARAFESWRRHPHGMPQAFQRRFLKVWQTARDVRRFPEGAGSFNKLARLFGAYPAALLLRRLRNPSYAKIRTMDGATLSQLLKETPVPTELIASCLPH